MAITIDGKGNVTIPVAVYNELVRTVEALGGIGILAPYESLNREETEVDTCQVCRGRLSHHILDAHKRVEDLEKQADRLTLEKAAEACHEIWAQWMRYYLSRRFYDDDYARWRRQMNTPYSELSESEKASDRAVARLYLPLEGEDD